MLELFSHMLEINSCTSCKGNLSMKVPNDPGKHLCHSFSSSVHPSSQLYSKVFTCNEPGFSVSWENIPCLAWRQENVDAKASTGQT